MKAWNKGKTKADFPQLSRSGVKKGNQPWNKGKKYPAPWLDKYRFGNRSKAIHNRKEKYTEEERKEIWGKSHKGKHISKKHKIALLQAVQGNTWNKGRRVGEETRKKMSIAQSKRTRIMIKNMLRRHEKSSLEIVFEKIIKNNKLPYKWVGNGQVMIGRKNPDFVNTNGKKIAIEVYYRKHKNQFRSGLDKWKKDRKIIFSRYGWELLFFDETMVNENDVIKAIG